MPLPNPFRAYLKELCANLAAGNATEHTHRPALKALLEAAVLGVVATNGPRRFACSAPVALRGPLAGGRGSMIEWTGTRAERPSPAADSRHGNARFG